MSKSLIFWVLMVIWAVFVGWSNWSPGQPGNRVQIGGTVLEFVLLFLLGWGIYGFVVQ